jgi:lipoprotein-releasing system permease protein
MRHRLEFFLALRYMSSTRGRGLSVITWIALLGVVVGVMSLTTVLAVMSGFERDLKEKILGNNAHLMMSRVVGSEVTLEETLESLKKNPLVDSAMKVSYGEAFLLGLGGSSEGAFLKGVDPQEVRHVLDLGKYLVGDHWADFESGGIILGASLAERLGVSPGDSVTLVLNKPEISPFGVVPRMKRLKVADIFKSGMTTYDQGHAYLTLSVFRSLFDREAYQLEVRAKDVREIQSLYGQVQSRYGEDFDVRDWLAANSDFLSALRLEKTVMGVILFLIVLVAAFNICGSLIMVVRDKTKDIAILKSMGSDNFLVLRVFLTQGLLIGAVGTLLGSVGGVVLSLALEKFIRFPLDPNVYMIDTLPVDLRLADILAVILGALLISLVATLYPAKLAAQLKPTEGLKVE